MPTRSPPWFATPVVRPGVWMVPSWSLREKSGAGSPDCNMMAAIYRLPGASVNTATSRVVGSGARRTALPVAATRQPEPWYGTARHGAGRGHAARRGNDQIRRAAARRGVCRAAVDQEAVRAALPCSGRRLSSLRSASAPRATIVGCAPGGGGPLRLAVAGAAELRRQGRVRHLPARALHRGQRRTHRPPAGAAAGTARLAVGGDRGAGR